MVAVARPVAMVATGQIVKKLKSFLLKTQEKLNNEVMFL